jgi:hypothetical protein
MGRLLKRGIPLLALKAEVLSLSLHM